MLSLWKEYKYYADKRFSTISGTLVYFFLMSVTPFLFWLTLLMGDVDFIGMLPQETVVAVAPIVNYLQTAAKSATGGAGVILILTSLWSSTNFFYHLQRSGEIIYDTDLKGGFLLRLYSVVVVLVTIVIIGIAATVPFFSASVLRTIMPEVVADMISCTYLFMFAFFAAYLLNTFACPYSLTFEETAGGVLLTVLLWILCALGFSIYLKFANPQKLYGAVAALFVFLLWCYLMVNSLVIGIIYNGRYARVGAGKKLLKAYA